MKKSLAKYWYTFLVAGNLLYVVINAWKLFFSFYPGLFAEIGEIIAIANLIGVMPGFLAAYRQEKDVDA